MIHGDGGHVPKSGIRCTHFQPELQEILDGLVCEIVEFGAFCHIGPLDALIHMSQIMNDYVEVDATADDDSVGKETETDTQIGDPVSARIVAVSLNELSARK